MTSAAGCFALFDGDDGGAVLLSDYRRTIQFDGHVETYRDLDSTFSAIESAAIRGEWLVLAVDYGVGSCFEPALSALTGGRRRLCAWVFGQSRSLDVEAVAVFLSMQRAGVAEHERTAGVADVKPVLDGEIYARKIEEIRRWITAGDGYQINLTFPIDFQLYGHPLALYARLRERQPVRHGAFIAVPGETLMSFSPELFFERKGTRVITRPMKGTAPRGTTLEEDEAQRVALLASEKERAENIMIVDLLRNDLSRLTLPGGVKVDALCATEAYPTLWQMVSTISADLPDVRLFDLFKALFPCGSITGAPKIAAMQKIDALETEPRGLYTGALGWVEPGGDCRFNVAIRTIELAENGRARLGVGSGIIIDADPQREYAECLLKARFLTGFDPGFELIETLRLEQGVFRLMTYHLERLDASARALGFACDLSVIAEAFAAHALTHDQGTYRVRLSVKHNGDWEIDSATLAPEVFVSPREAVIADERLDADDYLLRHKTTARSRYDRALRGLSDRPQIFDAIFLNTRGEVCEGARSTVFVESDGVLLTPPLSSGLLPGVMRRHLLESGRAVEYVLSREDLLNASTLYLGNALRGLIPVRVLVD